MAIKWCKWYWF